MVIVVRLGAWRHGDHIYITYVIVLQAEDRATEANKTCSRLQKDVDRIEGLLVNVCTVGQLSTAELHGRLLS